MKRAAVAVALVVLLAACADDDTPTAPAPGTSAPATSAEPTTTTAPSTPSTTASAPASPAPVDLCAYRDFGVWVDVFDSVAAFVQPGAEVPVTPDDVATMAERGARTLYLQVSRDDARAPGLFADEALAGEFLQAAHAAGMKVVAWYLPTHADPERDLAKSLALAEFTAGGEHFDSIALDIEGIEAVSDIAERNRRLLDLAAQVDAAAGDRPVGAIVYPPIVFDVLNTSLWPDFPWKELAPYVDVWLPMAYWTNRDASSPYRDAYRYTKENVERLRAHLDDPDAVVHVIGGIADKATSDDYEGFRRAAAEVGAIGWSVYDFATLDDSAWPLLRGPSTC